MYKWLSIINSIFTHLTYVHNFSSYLRVSVLPVLLMVTMLFKSLTLQLWSCRYLHILTINTLLEIQSIVFFFFFYVKLSSIMPIKLSGVHNTVALLLCWLCIRWLLMWSTNPWKSAITWKPMTGRLWLWLPFMALVFNYNHCCAWCVHC